MDGKRCRQLFGEAGGFGRASAGGDVQALLDQGDQLLLAHELALARVLKELLAAKLLIIRVLDPAHAQNFVRQVMHVFEDRHYPPSRGECGAFVRSRVGEGG